MKWPKKEEREPLEIEGFIEAYENFPHGRKLRILSKGERPDYLVADADNVKFGVELTSVYLSDRSVPSLHIPDGDENAPFPQDESQIPAYRDRLAAAVKEKVRLAKSGYKTNHPLILSVYVNEYVSIFMSQDDWKFLAKVYADIFENMDPFSEVVFWKLANGHIFSVNKRGSCFI